MATCNAHCRGCDRCFTGLKAFDKHRHAGKWGCLDPEDIDALKPSKGDCRVDREPRRGVRVWGTR